MQGRSDTGLVLIALFKLVKAALLVAAGVLGLKLFGHDPPRLLSDWASALGIDPDNRWVHAAIGKALNVGPKKLAALSVGTFVYAAVFLVEGVGLLLRKR